MEVLEFLSVNGSAISVVERECLGVEGFSFVSVVGEREKLVGVFVGTEHGAECSVDFILWPVR